LSDELLEEDGREGPTMGDDGGGTAQWRAVSATKALIKPSQTE
jgi:hypothetical protein